MTQRTIAALGLCFLPLLAFAQDSHPSSLSTTVPSYARYEVVQSPLVAKLTIRLDRFTGETWQFVTTAEGGFAWQLIPRIGAAGDEKNQAELIISYLLAEFERKSPFLLMLTPECLGT